MLSVKQICEIAETCLNLTHLGVDLDRDAETGWPNDTITAILKLPSITSLTFGLEIGADLHNSREPGEYSWNPEGLSGPGPFREPRMSLNVSEALFMDMRSKKLGRDLERVEFIVGDWPDYSHSGPIYIPSWEEGRERKFVCQADPDAIEGERRCHIVGGMEGWEQDIVEGEPLLQQDVDVEYGEAELKQYEQDLSMETVQRENARRES